MKLKCKVKVKNNFKNFENIQKKLLSFAKENTEDVLKRLQVMAIRLENGHNSKGILVELVDTSNMQVKGRVYANPADFTSNNQSYLWFEYFGTGAYAEKGHIGKTRHFIETGYTEWYIPVKKVGRALNYPIVQFGEQEFYVAQGAKANHFLSDAEFKTRTTNLEETKKKLKNMLKEVCG